MGTEAQKHGWLFGLGSKFEPRHHYDGRALGRASPIADDFGYTWTAGTADGGDGQEKGKNDALAEAQAALFGGGDFLPGFGSLDVL